jgi:hypothetical protein
MGMDVRAFILAKVARSTSRGLGMGGLPLRPVGAIFPLLLARRLGVLPVVGALVSGIAAGVLGPALDGAHVVGGATASLPDPGC